MVVSDGNLKNGANMEESASISIAVAPLDSKRINRFLVWFVAA